MYIHVLLLSLMFLLTRHVASVLGRFSQPDDPTEITKITHRILSELLAEIPKKLWCGKL